MLAVLGDLNALDQIIDPAGVVAASLSIVVLANLIEIVRRADRSKRLTGGHGLQHRLFLLAGRRRKRSERPRRIRRGRRGLGGAAAGSIVLSCRSPAFRAIRGRVMVARLPHHAAESASDNSAD